MKTAEKKNKGGRPKGKKTQNYKQVVDVRPACPHCNSTQTKIKHTHKPVEASIKRDGIFYNSLVRRLVKCNSCGLCHMKLTYENR